MADSKSQALPPLEWLPLREVYKDEEKDLNPACKEMIDRIVEPIVGEEVEYVDSEYPCHIGGGRTKKLDLLAITENFRVAIELQYEEAEEKHLGKLVGFYGPASEATHRVLIAESFPPSMIQAARDREMSNLVLMRAAVGFNSNGEKGIAFDVIQSSAKYPTSAKRASTGDPTRGAQSIASLGDALSKYGLKDSNARDYVRLFPVKDKGWASVYMHKSRVVVRVNCLGHGRPSEARAQIKSEDWEVTKGSAGGYLCLPVSADVDNYLADPEAIEGIADTIASRKDEIQDAVAALLGTIDEIVDEEMDMED